MWCFDCWHTKKDATFVVDGVSVCTDHATTRKNATALAERRAENSREFVRMLQRFQAGKVSRSEMNQWLKDNPLPT